MSLNEIFPAWFFGPHEGQKRIIDSPSDVPNGWTRTPPAAPSPVSDQERQDGLAKEVREAKADIAKLTRERDEAVAIARERVGVEERADKLEVANRDLERQLREARDELELARADLAKFDRDGDGKPGGSAPPTDDKKALVADLTKLGVDFDARWSVQRLQALKDASGGN